MPPELMTVVYYLRMLIWNLPPCVGGLVLTCGAPIVLFVTAWKLQERKNRNG